MFIFCVYNFCVFAFLSFLVIGKTTYCTGMQEYLRLLGRNAWVINLDPANEVPSSSSSSKTKTRTMTSTINEDEDDDDDNETTTTNNISNNELPYETLLDVCDSVVNLSSVMKQLGLGPNGGLIYCMEYIEAHVTDIINMIYERIISKMEIMMSMDNQREGKEGDNGNNNNSNSNNNSNIYLLFDLPGQVELYTHSTCVQQLLHKLSTLLDLRLTAIQLIDAHYCADANKFLSAALLGTTTMIRLELPMVCVLSKIDLLAQFGELPFALDFFTDCQELTRLVPFLDAANLMLM